MTKVLSVGGSIVVPNQPDTEFLTKFITMVKEWLSEDASRKLILVVGGGAPARVYQNAYSEISETTGISSASDAADWIGIMATRLNAQLVKAAFGDLCQNDVVYDPTAPVDFKGRVLLAEKHDAKVVVNLSNIEKVYTDDPRKNPDAKPIDQISWADFRKMVGDEWTPGKNCPFDPIASKKADECGMTVICAGGKNIENIRAILNDEKFIGTQIG